VNYAEVRGRLDELEKKSKLEKRLAKDDNAMLSIADMAFVLQIFAFLGLFTHIVFMANTAGDTKDAPSREDFAWFAVLGLVTAVLHFGWKLLRSRRERTLLRLLRKGEVVPAAMVMVNNGWFDDDNTEWWPGAVLVSFDPRAKVEPAVLMHAASGLFALRKKDRRTLPSEQGAIAWQLYHEMGPGPSVAVPPSLCGGLRDCMLVSAKLPPNPMRDRDLLVCLALAKEWTPDGVRILPADVLGA
jgi:hypothetical protein